MTIDVGGEFDAQYPVFSYTATKLSPPEVARTFVPPAAFSTLRDARNAILVGPRGSGKTTLLKMLTPDGLTAWQGPEASLTRQKMADVGVFVGVDAMWSEQIDSAAPEDRASFGAAAYALHIARSFIQTLIFRTGKIDSPQAAEDRHLSLSLTKIDEQSICGRAARLFKLPQKSSSLRSLNHDLGDRLNELGSYRYRLRDGQRLPEWAYLNPLHAVAELAGMVNELGSEPHRRWALLFDELELAPETIVDDILARLRGHEPLLIFKLSLAPILRSTDLLTGERGATDGQDVEYIPLTTAERSDTFVSKIFDKQREAATLPRALNPRAVLGASIFDAGDRGGRHAAAVDPYRRGSQIWESMRWLRDNDATFAGYLLENGISLDELELLSAAKRASHIRKIRNLAVVRAHFRNGARIDTQSTRQLYAGEATMLAIPDGNPRMSTILMREIVSALDTQPALPLPRSVQATILRTTTTRFLALLHAQTGIRLGTRAVTMVNLVDAIGQSLHSRLVNDRFSPDVPAGFFVDESVPEHFLPLLKQAVNTGAIIHIPKNDSSLPVSTDARGRHYRLSYLLAPRYGLPLRQGKTVALTNLLSGGELRTSKQQSSQPVFLDLEVDQ